MKVFFFESSALEISTKQIATSYSSFIDIFSTKEWANLLIKPSIDYAASELAFFKVVCLKSSKYLN